MVSESQNPTPVCIGIIMDGNRRFAKKHGLQTMEGHRIGYAKAKEISNWCRSAGIKYLILYAFSTENWGRSAREVSYLTSIFKHLLWSKSEIDELRKKNGAIRFIGNIESFGVDFEEKARIIEAENPAIPQATIVLAISYGGRRDIIHAVNNLLAKKIEGPITEKDFARYLWTADIPDPDLIIRSGGESRLSNFLPWQSVYSELFFTDTYWPEFTQKEFLCILEKYSERKRRMGK